MRFTGEMAEWSNAAVLKTVDCNRSGGSNPSFSAGKSQIVRCWGFFILYITPFVRILKIQMPLQNYAEAFVCLRFMFELYQIIR